MYPGSLPSAQRFQWLSVWSNNVKQGLFVKTTLAGGSVMSGEDFCWSSFQSGPMGLTRYWVPKSGL